MRIRAASCIATSSPRTSCSTARADRCSRISVPARRKATTLEWPAGLAVLRQPAAARRANRRGPPTTSTVSVRSPTNCCPAIHRSTPHSMRSKIATEPVPRLKPVKPIPPRLELLVSWMLAKQGRERPPSMRHVADEMNAVLQDTLGLEDSATDVAAESEAAILGAAADNLTPALMAEESPLPASERARTRRDRSGHAAARRRTARAGDARAALEQPRRSWAIAAVLVVVAGGVALLLPKFASEQKVDVSHAAASRRAHRSGAGGGEARRGTHQESHRTQQTPARSRFARRRAVGRSGIRGRAQDRSTTSAACSSGASTKARPRRSRNSRRRSPPSRRDVPEALTAQLTEGKRALAAGEFENSRQAFDTALKIDPQNAEATEWLGKVAAASGVLPTLADAENAEAAKDLPKAQNLFADVLKRNPGNVAATEGLCAREARHGGKPVQRGDGRGPGRAQRRTPGRGAHASHAREPAAARQRRGSRGSAASHRHRQRAQYRGDWPIARRASSPKNAGPKRWRSTTKRWRAILRCSSHRRAVRPWRRARTSATGCRHS